jgi:hypothetical protein
MTGIRHAGWRRVYGVPIVVGALSLAGLLSALLLGNVGRYFAWCVLAVPPAIAMWAYARSRKS